MRRAWAILTLITMMAAAGCGITESATPLPEVIVVTVTPDVQATVDAGVAEAVRQTQEAIPPTSKPYPTLQATPTLIPVPTRPPEPSPTPTVILVASAAPTPTPAPTVLIVLPTATPEGHTAPEPTATPVPSPTANPTPWPTAEPWPTATPRPWPTSTPVWQAPTLMPTPNAEEEVAFTSFGNTEYFPIDVWTAADTAQELTERGLYEQAISEYQRAISLHDKPSAVLENNLGFTYSKIGDEESAIDHYSRAIAIEDGSVRRSNRAISYQATGRCDLARPDAEAVLGWEDIRKDGISLHQNAHDVLYLCYQQEADIGQAIYHFDQFLRIARSLGDEDISVYESNLAWLHLGNDDCQQAEAAAERSLRTPAYVEQGLHSHAEAHHITAMCHAENHSFATALWHAERASHLMHENYYSTEEIENIKEWVELLREATS